MNAIQYYERYVVKKGTIENFRMQLDGQIYKVRREHIDQHVAFIDVWNLDGSVPIWGEAALVYVAADLYKGAKLVSDPNAKLTKV